MGYTLPMLKPMITTREMINDFGGYNHNLRIQENEFYDMRNCSGDLYPLLAPRRRRGILRKFAKPNGLYAHEKLCWVDGTDFYYDGAMVGTVKDSPKQFVGMGAYVLIWPDKVYYNSTTGEFGSLGAKTTTGGTVTISLCKLDGTDYTGYTVSATAPASPANGALWIDTSSTPNVLKIYSSTQGMWQSVPTTYAKISATGIGAAFGEHDGVSISGMDNTDLNGEFILQAVGDDYIIITALINAVATQSTPVTIERKIPDMDYLCESENRVWGCSSEKHEIYACKLGDAKNWNCYMGISTDSYAATVGTSGAFTGCFTHLGYVLFFKEDVIHKVYGNKPGNYQITNTNCRGVEKGSEKSLALVNETLYYKARGSVVAYNSALPTTISDALGSTSYMSARGGAIGTKYYISMLHDDGTGVILVHDERTAMWHKEDDIYASDFAALDGELYFIADNTLYSVNGSLDRYGDGAKLEGPVTWYAETGDIGMNSPDNKYISKLQLRIEVEDNALIHVDIRYDGEDAWTEKYRINITNKRSFTVPIIPRRCDTMRIRLWGTGECRVYSLTKTIEQGSEI